MARHIERFAPSPTGPLHIGHAFSAITAFERAHAAGGEFLLRIEDTDITRARKEWEDQIFYDLRWLGLSWPEPVIRQSDRFSIYKQSLTDLWRQGLIYPCSCNRRDIAEAATKNGVLKIGPDGVVYPGTCREKTPRGGTLPPSQIYRLDMQRAIERISTRMRYLETGHSVSKPTWIELDPQNLINNVGDVALARHGTGTSYHFSVVIDDEHQNITHVSRGEDVRDATQIHVLLQHILGYRTPTYHHHRLICDENGKRLAKRDNAKAIRTYRENGATQSDIREMIGL